jgi:hypothetical protein
MTDSYHYNVSGPVIWSMHIILGLFLIYFGYASLKNKTFPDWIYIGLIVLGVIAILYHSHIWITDNDEKKY